MSIFNKVFKKTAEEKKATDKSQEKDAAAKKTTDTGAKKKADSTEVKKTDTVKKQEKKVAKTPIKKLKGTSDQAYSVIIHPMITEKSAELASEGKYVFSVAPATNKVEVKKAIRTLYGVEPVAVNIVSMSGKKVSFRRQQGKRKDWKKAIVTLKKGQTIEVYEGV